MQVQNDRIAALATPYAESALAVIRTTGDGCIEAISRIFSRPDLLRSAPGNTIHHGFLSYEGEAIDEVMIAVFRAPRSYTGQESTEISCHGSPAGIQRVLQLLFKNGFRQADPGEFTLRGFLNGKMDLTRAEAVKEIVNAQSQKAHALALDRLGGAVFQWIERVKSRLVHILAAVEVQLDYPDDELEGSSATSVVVPEETIDACMEELQQLAATYRAGRIYQEGVKVAIAGRTNAGKSSLFNVLLREERAIVSEFHGTTRDYLEGMIVLEGIPIRLYDTAGLRTTAESVESEGIRRSGLVIEGAACILYVVDGTAGLVDEDRSHLRTLEGRAGVIHVWNKIDAADAGPAPDGYVALSAESGQGLDHLSSRIVNEIGGELRISQGEPVIDSIRQKTLIEGAIQSLGRVKDGLRERMPLDVIALDVQESVHSLGEITGEVTSSDVLDVMFSGFCVGK